MSEIDIAALHAKQMAEYAEIQEREKIEQERARIVSLLKRSGIPRRHEGSSLANFEKRTPQHERAYQLATEYVVKFDEQLKGGRCLLLVGKAGTGKTHLSCSIVRALCEDGFKAEYHRVPDMIRMLRECWRKDSNTTELQYLGHLRSLDLLVLDEVGTQFGTDGEKFHLFDVIDARYMDMRPTIIASNCETSELLGDFLGDRALDRLREGGGSMIVLGGKSKRGEK